MQASAPAWRESPTRNDLLTLQQEDELRFDDVAAEAGDVEPDDHVRRRLQRLRATRGDEYYVGLWFALTHQRLDARRARSRWEKALAHRERLARLLGRNVGIAVATLDYLHNAERVLARPVLLDAHRLDRIASAATHDELTGLFDRRAMQTALQRELSRAQREQIPVSVLLIDVDHFKRFNDRHGHLQGDAALQHVALSCVRSVRQMDVVCRYGGEEICVVLPRASLDAAVRTAERIRAAIREEGQVTVSVGVATCPDGTADPEDLIRAADRAMYAAKRAGRDRTHVAKSVAGEPTENL